MQANKLTLYFNKSAKTDAAPAAAPPSMGSGDIDHIVAEGDVHFVRPQQKARGDNAVYQATTDTVTTVAASGAGDGSMAEDNTGGAGGVEALRLVLGLQLMMGTEEEES